MKSSGDSLASHLSVARSRKGLTLRAVEAATGISNAYLSQLETGKIREPSPSYLHKLGELYDVSYATLLELAGHPVPGVEVRRPSESSIEARLGPTTKEEEDALAEYLAFLRTKRSRGGR